MAGAPSVWATGNTHEDRVRGPYISWWRRAADSAQRRVRQLYIYSCWRRAADTTPRPYVVCVLSRPPKTLRPPRSVHAAPPAGTTTSDTECHCAELVPRPSGGFSELNAHQCPTAARCPFLAGTRTASPVDTTGPFLRLRLSTGSGHEGRRTAQDRFLNRRRLTAHRSIQQTACHDCRTSHCSAVIFSTALSHKCLRRSFLSLAVGGGAPRRCFPATRTATIRSAGYVSPCLSCLNAGCPNATGNVRFPHRFELPETFALVFGRVLPRFCWSRITATDRSPGPRPAGAGPGLPPDARARLNRCGRRDHRLTEPVPAFISRPDTFFGRDRRVRAT